MENNFKWIRCTDCGECIYGDINHYNKLKPVCPNCGGYRTMELVDVEAASRKHGLRKEEVK